MRLRRTRTKCGDGRIHNGRIHNGHIHNGRIHGGHVRDGHTHDDRMHDDRRHDDRIHEEKPLLQITNGWLARKKASYSYEEPPRTGRCDTD